MAWLHPAVGVVATILVVWMALAGLDGRRPTRQGLAARRRHRRFTPVAASLAVLAAILGTASVVWVREDMAPARTWHFRIGWLCAAFAGAAWLSSRGIHRSPTAKALHPWLGIGLLAAAVASALLGIEHLP